MIRSKNGAIMSDTSWLFFIGNELVPVKETTWEIDGQPVPVPDHPLLVEDREITFEQFVSKYAISLDLFPEVYLTYLQRPTLGYVLARKGPPGPPKAAPAPWQIPQWYPKDFTERA